MSSQLSAREILFAVIIIVLATAVYAMLTIGSGGDYYVAQVVNTTVPGSIHENTSLSTLLQPVSLTLMALIITIIVIILGIILYKLLKTTTTSIEGETLGS